MDKEKIGKGASMFSRTENMFNSDPMQEIFELNLGDFMVENLISEDLAKKISINVHDKLNNLKNQLKELISIYSIDKTLGLLGFDNQEGHIIFSSIARTAQQIMGIENCHIFLSKENCHKPKNSKALHLVGTSNRNLSVEDLNKFSLGLNENNIVSMCFKLRRVIELKSKKEIRSFDTFDELNEENVAYQLAIPMYNNLENVGVFLFEKRNEKPIEEVVLHMIKVTAAVFATSMVLQTLTEEVTNVLQSEHVSISQLQQLRAELTGVIGDLGEQQQQFVEGLAASVDYRTHYSHPHSKQTADLAKLICENLDLNEKTTDLIYYAALLQNIGKIAIPCEVFDKKEALSKEDWQKLENHPNVGVNLMMHINFLSEVIPYIKYHKEKWDGTGKPEGLKGYSIPFGSRIIAVADAYCALTTDRSHRKAFSKQEALEIMHKEAGTKWDPMLVDMLEQITC